MKSCFLLVALLTVLSGCVGSTPSTASTQPVAPAKPWNILILGGGNSHDFKRWYGGTDAATLGALPLATVVYTEEIDTIVPQLARTDVLCVANNKPFTQGATKQAIMDYADRGKGIVLLHAGMWYSWRDWPEFNRVLVGGGASAHDAIAPFDVTVSDPAHPIMKGVPASFSVTDELYNEQIDRAGTPVHVLATSFSKLKNTAFPSVFIVQHPRARIVGIALGHDGRTHDLPVYQQLLKNSVVWAGGR